MKNPWVKLAVVSLLGIVVSFGVLWGVNEFTRYNNAQAMYGYNMNMAPMNNMSMNMQGNMNMQGGMNMMPMDNMNGMGMMKMDNMNGMGMMGGMKMH
ncbi:hypothetical protein HNQ80_001549 [Anaerosolibacter carboniphilus]|uniref:Uncharacterized protein n=1 Tax=Anaerosolibacter carboniphilus TaxID=1417629 RepID=A0A841KTV6_9FIRM|nr:hypothetical protein [Anaerosolibacter carboniphilus]MBB6215460.1 hypothetical protein [Anaerosolibacter carboniphilus]